MNNRAGEKPVLTTTNALILVIIAIIFLFTSITANLFPSPNRREVQHSSVAVTTHQWASKQRVNRAVPSGRWLQDSDSSHTEGVGAVGVSAVFVDKNNVKWFTTGAGIISYDGMKWEQYDRYDSIPVDGLTGVLCLVDTGGSELWIASPQGVTIARMPLDDQATIITLNPENSGLSDQDVLSMAAGKSSTRWIGTRMGISAFSKGEWLSPEYHMHYPTNMFRDYPITALVTSPGGDTLYVGTAGAGVARVYKDQLDAISGASVIAVWGPIFIPSNSILSVFVAADGARWFGTSRGVARHTGDDLLYDWTVYTVDEGLIDNQVKAIIEDVGGNMWFGTGAGISVFDGTSWSSYTTQDGLVSNNIQCIAIDQDGMIWIGTDAGINSYKSGEFITY